MEWSEAKLLIEENIKEGIDVNSEKSTLRKILETNYECRSSRYGYYGEKGFLVQISNYSANDLRIPWSMLENCFNALRSPEGYNVSFFRNKYQLQVTDHPCHVHVVGAIFEKAGLAYRDGNTYFIKK